MEINPNSMLVSIQGITERTSTPDALRTGRNMPGPADAMTQRISPLGNLAGTMPALSVDQQAELRVFRDEMRAALTSGSFDAAEMAGKAPEFMKQHAADKGVLLEDAFQQLGDRVHSLQALKSGLPAVGYSDLGQGQNDLLQSLLTALGEDQ